MTCTYTENVKVKPRRPGVLTLLKTLFHHTAQNRVEFVVNQLIRHKKRCHAIVLMDYAVHIKYLSCV